MQHLTDNQQESLQSAAVDAANHVQDLPQQTTDLDVYLVGGAVRDALRNRSATDLDFVVVGETTETMRDRGFYDLEASSFGVFLDENGEEWALARTETKTGEGYKGISVETNDISLSEDLCRRDFRMNAMAIGLSDSIPDGFDGDELLPLGSNAVFIDPFKGRRDLAAGVINHINESFTEDPLRIMRAARYASRFETTGDDNGGTPFTVASETKNLMRLVAPELNRMSRERLGEEVQKAMRQATNPTRFWDVLQDVGALAVIAPFLDRATIVPAGPERFHREGDTYTHTMMVLNQMHQLCVDRNITGSNRARRLLMAIAHDLGKVEVANKKGGLWSDNPPRKFPNHGQTGVSRADTLARRMGLPPDLKAVMRDAAQHHMRIHDLPTWEAERLIEFVDERNPPSAAKKPEFATICELIDLAQADHQGRFQNTETDDIQGRLEDDPDAPPGAGRPVFEREEFTKRVEKARKAIETISGYEVMRDGLCSIHESENIPDEDLAAALSTCDDCRTPDSWVQKNIRSRRYAFVTESNEE